MRIVEVITGGEAGGAQRHVAELTLYLADRGHDVHVVHGGGDWLSQRVEHVATVHYMPPMRRAISGHDLVALRDLTRVIRDLRPAVVHAHSSKAGILARRAGMRLGVPVIYTAHGMVFTDPMRSPRSRWLYRVLETWGSRHSAAVIVMTRYDEAFVRRVAPKTLVAYIPNGVTVQKGHQPTLPDRLRIGFLGRFSAEKGLPTFLTAARMNPQWTWMIAGDGALRALVTEAVKACPQVSWRGWIDNPEEFFREIDVLVQPSFKEGLPYTVLDALARGIPVVSTPVGGLPDLMTAIDGALLFPVGDAAAMVRAVQYVAHHYAAIAQRSQTVIAEHYTLEHQLRNTEAVLLQAETRRA
ncbi:MAG: glycosyltransferase [Sulfobacillus thermotolerans]|nr:glycosyltransferase [Sulfobacillus thermotolerans]